MRFWADKQEKIGRFQSYARAIVFYRRVENNGRTNQIRVFPIEHSWVSTYVRLIVRGLRGLLNRVSTVLLLCTKRKKKDKSKMLWIMSLWVVWIRSLWLVFKSLEVFWYVWKSSGRLFGHFENFGKPYTRVSFFTRNSSKDCYLLYYYNELVSQMRTYVSFYLWSSILEVIWYRTSIL